RGVVTLLGTRRNGEGKGCPRGPGLVDPDPTAQPLHDAAAGGKPQPASRRPGLTADKGLEDLLAQVGGNAPAVVAAAHRPRPVLGLGVGADPGGASAPVLDGVLDAVLEH